MAILLAAQCRAARGLLGWSQEILAVRAGLGLSTVRDLETERREVSTESLGKIRAALEREGVAFIDADAKGGPGVRLSARRSSR
ncbi:MAG: helix-turn-helix transcriptional regulator [Hyphomicrobiaceae bacterium]|nr:MAG: helix-turn-helix transcriptional regulator [Hyphomicrobiaceae bacterium]